MGPRAIAPAGVSLAAQAAESLRAEIPWRRRDSNARAKPKALGTTPQHCVFTLVPANRSLSTPGRGGAKREDLWRAGKKFEFSEISQCFLHFFFLRIKKKKGDDCGGRALAR